MGGACTRSSQVHASPPPLEEPGSAWIAHTEEDGTVYYYNYRDGSYTYEPQHCDWSRICDDWHDHAWWYNARTRESRWDPPAIPTPLEPSIDALLRFVLTMRNAPVHDVGDLPVATIVT